MGYDGPTELYIDGEWMPATGEQIIETVDPATEESYATVACATPKDVDRAAAAADSAAARDSNWRSLDPSERTAYLH